MQGDGAIAQKKQVIQAEVFFERELQFVDQGAVVRQPVAFPDAIEVALILSLGRKEGFGNRDHLEWVVAVVFSEEGLSGLPPEELVVEVSRCSLRIGDLLLVIDH